MRPDLAVVIRLLAFVGKEIAETIRRPGAIISLVLGPFLIMAVFGLGYSGVKRPLATAVVAPESSGLPADTQTIQELAGGGLRIVLVTRDRAAGEAELTSGRADVLVIAPEDAEARFRAGEQSVIEVLVNAVDPVEVNYAGFLAAALASEINREVIERVAERGQGYAVAAGEPDADAIPPEVVAAPTRAELVNIAPSTPGVMSFFGPAVLALILQHLAVTEPVRTVAFLLPVTHGIRLLQDLLLRGGTTEAWEFLALAAIALVTLVGAWAVLRREMTRA